MAVPLPPGGPSNLGLAGGLVAAALTHAPSHGVTCGFLALVGAPFPLIAALAARPGREE